MPPHRRSRAATIIASALAMAASAPRVASGQRAADTRAREVVPGHAFCVRGQPIRACRSFAVIELPVGATLHTQREGVAGSGDAHIGLELGAMINRSELRAVGATASAAYSGGEAHFAISARSRTWFSGDSYRDVSVGLLALGSSAAGTGYGLTATTGSGYRDLIGLWAGGDVTFIGSKPRAALRAGAKLGSYSTLGVLGLAAALVGLGGGVRGD